MQIVGLNANSFSSRKFGFEVGDQLVFWGASKFFGGPVSFQIYWPPGPVSFLGGQ